MDGPFGESAPYYDDIYHFKDYKNSCKRLRGLIQRRKPGARTLLDVACGTGRHLELLQPYYEVEGLDISRRMLDLARQRCPSVPLHQASMIDFDLNRQFDVVTCLFSSIGYVTTLENLQRSISSMARHVAPGGLLFVEPWLSPDTYRSGDVTLNVVDRPDIKIVWMYRSVAVGRLSIHDIHYLVGTPKAVEHFTEHQEIGLFTSDEYEEAFRSAGFDVTADSEGLFGRGLFVGIRDATR